MLLKPRSLGITNFVTSRPYWMEQHEWDQMKRQLEESHAMIPITATINRATRTEKLYDRKSIMFVHREDWAKEWAARKVAK